MMKRLTLFGFLFAVGLSSAGVSADTEPSCVKADAELNRVYKKILKTYKDDPLFLKKLKVAQRAWIKFRDGHMDSVYPADDKREYGSIYGECSCNDEAQVTQARVKQLKVWLKGIPEGDGCSGSVKMTHQLQ